MHKEDIVALKNGFENLDKHIENMRYYGFNPVISINKFDTDNEAELNLLKEHCNSQNVPFALNESRSREGEGAIELANMIVKAVNNCPSCLKPLYDLDWTVEKKIETIATKMYGADHVEYTVLAKQQLKKIEELGLGNLAVCIAKTQKSLSDNEHKKGCPKGFTFKIREVELSSGAGFIVPIAGTIMRMPGLPANPSAEKIDVDENGKITGLF